jgi:hypothetical protein
MSETASRSVVRLATSCWQDISGAIHIQKSLRPLKRKSSGYQFLQEDASMAGVDLVFNRITNLSQCEDGIYEVRTCNEYKDWETGHIEDYDYVLVPYQEP